VTERFRPAIDEPARATESFCANLSRWQDLTAEHHAEQDEIKAGGGPAATQRQHEKARLTARERIARLADVGAPLHELMIHAARGMYSEWGGAPAAGVITGIARIHQKPWMVIANDATVKAGAFFPLTSKKVIRAQTIALENRLPTIYLVDSAGVFLPLQDEIFPDQDDFGRVFYLNARMTALGVPQISAIMGNCVAGGAYLPVMCDRLIMTEGSGLYLAGPALVRAAIGQVQTSEEIGGAQMHARISGTADFREADDDAALARLRDLCTMYGDPGAGPYARRAPLAPTLPASDLTGIIPPAGNRPYEIREVIARVVDGSEFDEYRAEYGQTIVCAYAWIDGRPVGIVANQKTVIKTPQGLQVGGVIYPDSAEKAARFVLDCNQALIPLVFLQDVNGFMVGKAAEQSGIIRSGAKLVNAISNSRVPKITVIIGGSYGAGNYALAGKAYGPRLIYAWPSAKYAVMGGQQAAKTLLDLRIAQLKKDGRTPSAEEQSQLLAEIQARYDETLDIRYAASRLWIDAIIEPARTREVLAESLAWVTGAGDVLEPLRTGVFQV